MYHSIIIYKNLLRNRNTNIIVVYLKVFIHCKKDITLINIILKLSSYHAIVMPIDKFLSHLYLSKPSLLRLRETKET